MGISDRIEGSIEKWRVKWSEILRVWLVNILSFGIETLMDVIGKAFAPRLIPFVEKLEATGEVPPEFQPILDEIKTPSGQIASILAYSVGGSLVGGAIGKVTDALFMRCGYTFMRWLHPILPTSEQAIAYWLRHPEFGETLDDILKAQGAEDLTAAVLKDLSQARLDVATITALWRRDKTLYEPLWKDLQDQGISPARIAFFKELAKIIPPLPDMVRFADFSAFDPTVIARWREFYDAPGWITEPMELIGITNEEPRDWANKYWFSHWRQPGRFELGEMYRRGLLGEPRLGGEEIGEPGGEGEAEDTIKLAYRTMGYSSFWQDALLQLVREVPTRVDVRRWWDMRTIDEAELRSLYMRQGYFGKDLNNYILWTKVYVAFPDLIARFKNGWITEDDVKSELTALGMPSERVEEMIQTKVKTVAPERVEKERTATATEIMKAVKKELITRSEGVERLGRLGYSPEEAEFKLDVYIGVSEGSPESFIEFVEMTEKYRKAVGLEAQVPPPELVEAGKVASQARIALRDAEMQNKTVEELAPYQKALQDAEYRYRQLLIAWEEEKKGLT